MSKTLTETDVRELLRKRVEQAGGLRAFGRDVSLSAGFISRVLRGEKGPGPDLEDALGIEPLPRRWRMC